MADLWCSYSIVIINIKLLVHVDYFITFTESLKLYTCGDNRHGKLCHEEDEVPTAEGPQLVKKFENYLVTNLSCGGCHTIVCAQKTEEEFKKSINLPPLQRVPNTIFHEDSLHGFKSDSTDSADNIISDTPKQSVVNGVMNEIKSPLTAFTTEISEGIEEITSTANETVSAKKDEVSGFIDNSVKQMENKAGEITENVTEKIENIKNGINENVEELTTKTNNFLNDTKETVESSVQEKIEDFVKEAKDEIGSGMTNIMNMTGIKSLVENKKTDSIENLLDEINDEGDGKSSSGDTVSIISTGKYRYIQKK